MSRYNKRSSVIWLVLCLTIISKSDSFLTSDNIDTTNSSSIEKTDDNDINIDTDTEFKWVAIDDMITKIPIERRLDGMNNVMFNEDDFFPGDSNDKKKPNSNSGKNSFWELYDQLDNGKKLPIYTQQGSGSRPVLSKFRFIVVPIWWSDEDTSDPDKKIKNEVINDVMDYNKEYYKRMSFGKFNYQQHINLPQTMIPVSSQNPGFGDLDNACLQVIYERGYIKDVDYHGVVCLYNVAKNGPFSGHGGWGSVNSDLAITDMSWRWGLSNDVARHEFGHNFGHPHHLTNGYKWRFGGEGVVGYDDYDMMSGGNHYDISDFALASKWYFGWVPDSSVINMQPQGSTSGCPKCVSEGTYKLYPFDGDDASKKMGIHIPITRRGDTLYSYWLSYRSNNGAEKGLSVHVSWFGNIGNGQFGAYYDSLNYDAHGDTESRIDSFVLPGTCYHISPSVKMLEIDPSAAIATQPVVCVTALNTGKSITIDVSFSTSDTRTKSIFARTGSAHLNEFHKPRAMSTDDILMKCGTSKSLAVKSNANQLVHVDNTGVDGIITLTTSSSSATASAIAYIYDRYPTSPIAYSSPGGYGAFKSLSIPSDTRSIEYRAVHNEAWILISANSAVTYDISCTVNECQVGQKKVGKQCKSCQANDTDCTKCPGGLEFLISACVLSETVKAITTSKKWRLWTPDYHTLRGWVWDINDVKFYSNSDCTGSIFNDGTPINSGNAGGGWSAANAFDSNNGSAWGGRSDEDNLFWLGMKFNGLKKVQCVSILDEVNNGVSELRVQAWDSSTGTWQNVEIVKNYKSGQRNNIPLENISTPSPIAQPKDPTSAPTTAPVQVGPLLSFKRKVNFGKIVKVNFNNPNEPVDGTYPWIGVFKDTKGLAMDVYPDEDLLIAWLNDCNSQNDCDSLTQKGFVKFSAANPESDNNDYYFPFRNGKYRICFMNQVYLSDEDYVQELIGPCKHLVVKPPKKKMTKKASITAKANLRVGDTFTADFHTPIAIQNQWIGLYPGVNGKPNGDLGCTSLLWVYTACNNQEGDQTGHEACAKKKKRGSIQMDQSNVDEECSSNVVLPIQAGTYYMCVNFHNNEPYNKYKCSNKIEVTE